MSQPETEKKSGSGLWGFLKILGPGVITGAADDDPSGIATYAQSGAQYGFQLLWTALYQLPLMIAVQEACGRIGAVTGKGLAGVIRDHYGRGLLYFVVGLVVVANTLNIGADIGAVAESVRLLVDWPFHWIAIGAAVLILALEILMNYRSYAAILKWLAVALLAYPLSAAMTKVDWQSALKATLIPQFHLDFAFLFMVIGVFGTSISPYMFFWQASEEVEEEESLGIKRDKRGKPSLPNNFISDMRLDTIIGMIFSELGQWFIIVTTATVLFGHGGDIRTAADAARALEPLVSGFPNAGLMAKAIFAIGIIGLGLLGIPVLAGSAAYALSEAFGWREGLNQKFNDAKGFYGVIIVATLIGLGLNFIGIDPMKALVYTAVFNGIAAVPLLMVIALINGRSDILGPEKGGVLSQGLIWLCFLIMGGSLVALVFNFKV
jgi:NRAMP (natural resistance-associated macrophage protein)-like metal ion transporter